jgi:hypothetical protein
MVITEHRELVELPHPMRVLAEPTFPENSTPYTGVAYPVSAYSVQPPGGDNLVTLDIVATAPNTALVTKVVLAKVMMGRVEAACSELTSRCRMAPIPTFDIPVMRATLIIDPVALSPVQSKVTQEEAVAEEVLQKAFWM